MFWTSSICTTKFTDRAETSYRSWGKVVPPPRNFGGGGDNFPSTSVSFFRYFFLKFKKKELCELAGWQLCPNERREVLSFIFYYLISFFVTFLTEMFLLLFLKLLCFSLVHILHSLIQKKNIRIVWIENKGGKNSIIVSSLHALLLISLNEKWYWEIFFYEQLPLCMFGALLHQHRE